jgi:hypothetical protein
VTNSTLDPYTGYGIAQMLFGTSFGWVAIVVALALIIIPYWLIFSKAGWAGAISLVMWIPVVNIIILWVFAFSGWPIRKRVLSGGTTAPN